MNCESSGDAPTARQAGTRRTPGYVRRTRSLRVVPEEFHDLRDEPGVRREVPILPRVDGGGRGAEALSDIGLPKPQIQASGADMVA